MTDPAQDALVEAVAKALFETAYPGEAWAGAPAIAREPFFGLARVAIPIVREAAAAVAEDHHSAFDTLGDRGISSDYIAGHESGQDAAAYSIAAALRALGNAPEGE